MDERRTAGTMTRRTCVQALGAAGLGLAAGTRTLAAAPNPRRGAPAELLIRGGRVVNATGGTDADVRIVDGVITHVEPGLAPGADARVIEAVGKLVIPGGIDPHTHLHPPFADDLTSGSAAALAGGITTVGTFAFPGKDETMLQAVDRMAQTVREQAIADVLLHAAPWPPTDADIAALPELVARGQPSLKVYMVRRNFETEIANVIRLLEGARDAGVLTLIHCEDWAVMDAAARHLEEQGRATLANYGESRPVLAEWIATEQAAALCELTGAPLHVVHLSSARALDACRAARAARLPLTLEVRPMYLHLTQERLAQPDGPLYIGQPPLRTAADQEALWQAMASGDADMLATDHAPWTRAQKLDPTLTIRTVRPGVSDLRFMLPMYYSRGVVTGRLTPERFVETVSTAAARIMGLYPKKGAIQPGADGDVVVFDPARTAAIHAEDDPSQADYTVYEGWEMTGWPIMTIRRGEVVFEDGQVIGTPGTGELVARQARNG
jgi:dihydropyrimidinase